MWKRELLKNKLYALLLVGLSLPVMFLDGDATATVLMLKRIGVDIEAWHKESDHGT